MMTDEDMRAWLLGIVRDLDALDGGDPMQFLRDVASEMERVVAIIRDYQERRDGLPKE